MIVLEPAKAAVNIAKHGVSLRRAEELDLDACVIIEDRRHDYGEVRKNAYGMIDDLLYAFSYTERGSDVRAISLRRARDKEMLKWTRA